MESVLQENIEYEEKRKLFDMFYELAVGGDPVEKMNMNVISSGSLTITEKGEYIE